GGVPKWRLLGRDHRRRFRRLRLHWRLICWRRILRGQRFVRLSLLGIARDGLLGLPFVRLDRAFQLSERPLLWSAILLVFQKEYEEDGPDGHHGDAYAAQGKQKSARPFLFPRPRRFVAVAVIFVTESFPGGVRSRGPPRQILHALDVRPRALGAPADGD